VSTMFSRFYRTVIITSTRSRQTLEGITFDFASDGRPIRQCETISELSQSNPSSQQQIEELRTDDLPYNWDFTVSVVIYNINSIMNMIFRKSSGNPHQLCLHRLPHFIEIPGDMGQAGFHRQCQYLLNNRPRPHLRTCPSLAQRTGHNMTRGLHPTHLLFKNTRMAILLLANPLLPRESLHDKPSR
jgi:hypothetical protein